MKNRLQSWANWLAAHNGFALVVLGLLVLISRSIVLARFNFVYTGSDDLIFWQSVTDYLNGVFHEPYFYGQNYNFMLESVLAMPLVWLNVPINMALPIASSFLGLFPFFLFSFVLFRRKIVVPAFFFLLIPLSLSVEYEILTSVTRGFVTGIFFSGFLVFCLVRPRVKSSFVLLGLMVSLGFVFNPNSLILSFPICLYLLLLNYRNPAFYYLPVLAAIPALGMEFLAKQFYVDHPEHFTHGILMTYTLERIATAFTHLEQFFRYLMPVLWKGHWWVVFPMGLFGVMAWQKDKTKGIAIFATLIFAFATLGLKKVHEDMGTLFLSSARMFLAIPVFIGLCLWWMEPYFIKRVKLWIPAILLSAAVLFAFKLVSYNKVIARVTTYTNYAAVAIKKVDELTTECAELNNLAVKHNADLVIFVSDWRLNSPHMEMYNYGCGILERDFPKTVLNHYEKRSWVFQEESNSIRENVLIYGGNLGKFDAPPSSLQVEVLNEEIPILLVTGNTRTAVELLGVLNYDFWQRKPAK